MKIQEGNSVKVLNKGDVVFLGKVVKIEEDSYLLMGRSKEGMGLEVVPKKSDIRRTRLNKELSKECDEQIKRIGKFKHLRDRLYDAMESYLDRVDGNAILEIGKKNKDEIVIHVTQSDDERTINKSKLDYLKIKKVNGTYNNNSQNKVKGECENQWKRLFKSKLVDKDELVKGSGIVVNKIASKYFIHDFSDEFTIEVMHRMKITNFDLNDEELNKIARVFIKRLKR